MPLPARLLTLRPGLTARTGTRTEPALPLTRVHRPRHEPRTAVLTVPRMATQPRTPRPNSAEALGVCHHAVSIEHVAPRTGGHQVLRSVVHRVPVNVVNHQDTLAGSATRHPRHRLSAVVTGVRSRSDLVEQHCPMLRNVRSLQTQGVARRIPHPAGGHVLLPSVDLRAFRRAEAADGCGSPCVLNPTSIAGAGDRLADGCASTGFAAVLPLLADFVHEGQSAVRARRFSVAPLVRRIAGQRAEPTYLSGLALVGRATLIAFARSNRHSKNRTPKES